MSIIRPNAEPAVTAVASGDIFLIDGSTGVRALAATSVAIYDANGNATVNNLIQGFTSTATTAGTTTLTAASASVQYFTGTLGQTVALPVTSTLDLNQTFVIENASTGVLTVNSSGGNLVTAVGPGATASLKCVAITGTTAASWSTKFDAVLAASGKVLTVSNSLTLAGTDGTTQTFPATSATLARTDAGQTFTGANAFGVLTASTVNGNTFTTGTGVLTLGAGKTLTANNTLTLAGTDGTTQTFPATSATIARTDAGQTFTGSNTFGALTATTINGNVWTAGTGVLTIAAGKTYAVSNSLTLAGTDGTTQTFPSTNATIARTDAGQTFTGTNNFGPVVVTSASASALAVGLNGATNPALVVNASTASQATGLSILGLATGNGVALQAIDSGANTPMSINAKGSGQLFLQNSGTGGVSIGQALTYGGVTLSNSVIGTGSMALSASPTFTGTPAAPTAAPGTNTTQIASTAFVTAAVVASTTGVASFKTRTGAVVPVQGDYPTNLIPGTTTNDNATAGNIGEFVSSTVLQASAVSLTNGTAVNINSISLTAGDWDVWISGYFLPAASTTLNVLSRSISMISATANNVAPNYSQFASNSAAAGGNIYGVNVNPVRISLATTTTVFDVANALFGTSTNVAFGGIYARRVR